MSNQSIKYGILLTREQLDFLKDDRQRFHRMTAIDTFVAMASTKPGVYQKTGMRQFNMRDAVNDYLEAFYLLYQLGSASAGLTTAHQNERDLQSVGFAFLFRTSTIDLRSSSFSLGIARTSSALRSLGR